MRELSARERAFLEVVQDCTDNNYVPSNEELLQRTGVSSVSTLEGIKRSLLRRGFLQKSSTAPLGIEVHRNDEPLVPAVGYSSPEALPLQKKALEFIWMYQQGHSFSPNYREIGEAVGRSNESVSRLMQGLQEAGYIHRDRNVPRAIELTPRALRLLGLPTGESNQPSPAYIPLLGRIAAGRPSESGQTDEGGLVLPPQIIGRNDADELFLLRVDGHSMTEAGILDGDVVLVHRVTTVTNGDLVAAMLEEPAGGELAGTTVKRYRLQGEKAWLIPAHPAFQPIDGSHAKIQGKVIALLRWPLSAP